MGMNGLREVQFVYGRLPSVLLWCLLQNNHHLAAVAWR